MGCLGEDLLGLVFVSDSNHVTRVSRGKFKIACLRQMKMY